MAQANQYGSPPEFLKNGVGLTPKGIKQLNAWFQFLLDCQPIPGDDSIEAQYQPGIGRLLFSNFSYFSPSGASSQCPFDIEVTPESDTDYTFTVLAGTMNQLVPSNNFDTFSGAVSSLIKVKIRGLSDGAAITSCSIVADTSNPIVQTPTPFGLPSVVEVLIGVISQGEAFKTIACGPISLSGVEQFRTDKSPPAQPGELPYTPYYTWVLQ